MKNNHKKITFQYFFVKKNIEAMVGKQKPSHIVPPYSNMVPFWQNMPLGKIWQKFASAVL